MVDLLLPDVRVAKISPQIMDNTGRFSSPLSGTARSVARPGDRWSFQLDYQNLQGLDRARLESFIAGMRGAANRAMYSPGDYVQRGSFPSGELLLNNNFVNGTTHWGTSGSPVSLSVADRTLYVTLTGSGAFPQAIQNVTGAQYAPYVARALVTPARPLTIVVQFQDGFNSANSPSGNGSSQFLTASGVSETTTPGIIVFLNYNPSGIMAGDYFTCPWTSISRCMLVDNGANLLPWSDDFTNGAWGKTRSSTSLSGTTAPDGTFTADSLVEDTSTNTHYVSQPITVTSSSQDICFTVCANSATRNWLALEMIENTVGTGVVVYFNTATGAIGSNGTGANWSNLRSFIRNVGNGWYQMTIVARKTNAATSVSAFILLASADNTQSYTGTGTSGLQIWRATVSLSSVPVRLVQSAASAVTATAQTGSSLYVKGLPVSTNGLLLSGDWFEVNKELKRATVALNSDASGLGYLQFSPPLRNSPNDNDPVIVNMPMGRFTLKNPANGWAATPLYFASSSLVLEEAP
jgi:hypothetical protein